MFLTGCIMKINENYLTEQKYLFTIVTDKVNEFKKLNPKKKILNLGIGDVTRPLDKKIALVMTQALKSQCKATSFKGYPPETGYDFLKEMVSKFYSSRSIQIDKDEIFVSNGAGCDVTNILGLFQDLTAVIANPTYPAYVNSNILCQNSVIFLPLTSKNGYKMLADELNEKQSYLVYMCSPNNPTGSTLTRKELGDWVHFANQTQSIILFDNAYESFVEDDCPRSIYEIDGAKNCAIEISSFSKSAGFTNLRCGFTIVPKSLIRQNASVNKMWNFHQCIFFNGVPYHIQKGAEFVLSEEGQDICRKNIHYYKQNALILKNCLKDSGFEFVDYGNSPYIWAKVPTKQTSWEYFNFLLEKYNIVCMPGSGFGRCGEGYIRFSAFAKRDDILTAMDKILK